MPTETERAAPAQELPNEPRAIWAVHCQVDRARLAAYLDWFHSVHIQEKLGRPGYAWAAHYEVLPFGQAAAGPQAAPSFLALFGGTTTRAFLDPSPSQLKLRQDDATRRMMACRMRSQGLVLSEEWRETADGAGMRDVARGTAPLVELALIDLEGADEDYGAWLVQEDLPTLRAAPGWHATAKFLVAAGPARHAVLHEYDSEAAHAAIAQARRPAEGSRRWREKLRPGSGQAVVGRRIWPK